MNNISAVILAAGEGTRMKSKRAKVLHQINGQPMLTHLLNTLSSMQLEHQVVVLGYKKESVAEILPAGVAWVEQAQRLGTGHAVQQVYANNIELKDTVLVLCGDIPLLSAKTLEQLIETHQRSGSGITILSAMMEDPFAYGRIVRSANGAVERIVEEKDATEQERQIKEINSGIYCFEGQVLKECLSQLKPNNKQNEYYLTDVIDIARSSGGRVDAVIASDACEITGINSLKDLAWASRFANRKVIESWMDQGVTFLDPESVTVGSLVEIGRDAVIYPFVFLEGKTRIGANCEVGPSVRISDCQLGAGTKVQFAVLEHITLQADSCVVPFTHQSGGLADSDG